MNPYAINIQCDGAMSYDKGKTGGNGYYIEFPESISLDPIRVSLRNDGQGIHRLEMISILESMEELLRIERKYAGILRGATGVDIYTDRISATDSGVLNVRRISEYRKNNWKNHEGKPISDREIIDRIDKARKKLSIKVGGMVNVGYKKEKQNKVADKLSKLGKRLPPSSRIIFPKKKIKICRRKFSGSEINYTVIPIGAKFMVHLYSREMVGDMYKIGAEIISGQYLGKILKIYVDSISKKDIHINNNYLIKVEMVFAHHILAKFSPIK